MSFENETWLIDTGDEVISRQASGNRLNPLERAIYCLWVADYGMRNAGDLEAASDLNASFLQDGRDAAAAASLPKMTEAFSLPRDQLEQRYFELFDDLCEELRAAAE